MEDFCQIEHGLPKCAAPGILRQVFRKSHICMVVEHTPENILCHSDLLSTGTQILYFRTEEHLLYTTSHRIAHAGITA